MKPQSSHRRVNDILLGPLERPLLHWLAGKLPSWVGPDTLTLIGLLGSVAIFAGYALTHRDPAFLWLASAGYAINWFGDSLDGTVARFRHIERPTYGFVVDHIVDAVTTALIFLGFGVSPYVRFDIACLALIAYQLLTIQTGLRLAACGEFRISYGKIGPTELRVLVIIGNTLLFFLGNPTFVVRSGRVVSIGDILGGLAAFGFFLAYCIESLRVTLDLRRIGK